MPSHLGRPAAVSRRALLALMMAPGGLLLPGCGRQIARRRFPGSLADFEPAQGLPLRTLRIGPESGRVVVVLHELPGLTRDDLALARALGSRGFNVFAPVLFGVPEQDSLLRGYSAACRSDLFACSSLSTRSPILDTLAALVEELSRRDGQRPVAVIGMCLTGVLPLALLPHQVAAAVLCQPTVPFSAGAGRPTGAQKSDLGLSGADLELARASSVPFLLLRYAGDGRCPPERVAEFRRQFGTRLAAIELPGGHHSSLAGDFDDTAFEDVLDYLAVRFDPAAGPRRMRLARLQADDVTPCRIGADGRWHAD